MPRSEDDSRDSRNSLPRTPAWRTRGGSELCKCRQLLPKNRANLYHNVSKLPGAPGAFRGRAGCGALRLRHEHDAETEDDVALGAVDDVAIGAPQFRLARGAPRAAAQHSPILAARTAASLVGVLHPLPDVAADVVEAARIGRKA